MRAAVPYAFYGLCFDAPGRRLYASGGEDDLVRSYRFEKGLLSDPLEIPPAHPAAKGSSPGSR